MRSRIRLVLPIAAVFLLVFVVGFLLRTMDDNSLFSWSWAFANGSASRIYLYLVAGLAASFFLSSFPVPERYQVFVLAGVSFVAIVPFWQESEIILDASRYFTQAKHLELYGVGYFLKEWGRSLFAWTDMPLVPFLYGLIFTVFGENRIAIQVFTTTLFSLTAVFTFLIGEKLWNRETGMAAALLLLGIPYLLTQVPLMLVDVPVMFFLTGSVFTFLDAMDKGGGRRTISAIALILCAVLSKYSTWIMLSILVVALAVRTFSETGAFRRTRLKRGLFILAAACALSVMVLFVKYDVLVSQAGLLSGYQKEGLARWGESFLSTFLFQVHPFISAAAFFSVLVAFRRRDSSVLIACWLLLLVVVFGIRRIRYILPVFPMLTLLSAYGIQTVRDEYIKRFLVYGIVTSSLVVALLAYLPLAASMSTANLKDAGRYLDGLPTDTVEVIVIPTRGSIANPAVSVPLLDLFTVKKLVFHYMPTDFVQPQDAETSSLRFTWLYQNPSYYSDRAAICSAPTAILYDVRSQVLPVSVQKKLACYESTRSFQQDDGIFIYTIGVQVYKN